MQHSSPFSNHSLFHSMYLTYISYLKLLCNIPLKRYAKEAGRNNRRIGSSHTTTRCYVRCDVPSIEDPEDQAMCTCAGSPIQDERRKAGFHPGYPDRDLNRGCRLCIEGDFVRPAPEGRQQIRQASKRDAFDEQAGRRYRCGKSDHRTKTCKHATS